MSESSRLGRARGRALPAAFLAAALVAMLALAPLASAATPNPIASGSTTLTINGGFNNQLKKAGIKLAAIKPAKLKGTKATFTVTGGEIEATNGLGTIAQGGGLKLTWGKKSAPVKGLELNTKAKSLSATVGGKKVKLATLSGVKSARLGFGNSITTANVKLTKAGANALNQKLTPPPTKTKVKKNGKTVTKVVKTMPPFKANTVLGKTNTQVEPKTDNVLPTGTMTYNGDPTLLGKLKDVGVEVQTISPTTQSGTTFSSAISGGTISPLGTSGQVNSSGGLKLVQKIEGGPTTTITLAAIGVDLGQKTAGVEVIGESNAETEGKKPLNLGNLGRSSIADLTITSLTPNPATRTVAVNATATIQAVAAEVLNGFVKVYEGAYAVGAAQAIEAKIKNHELPELKPEEIKAMAEKAAAERVANDQIKSGESLGSFSFTATGE
ncbi:MAG: hypothetical protein JSU06_12770 [Actinobacteria bacterium]|nr:hypothetical protein [Actinomycetota bacterium]